jgi:hypothetical protein
VGLNKVRKRDLNELATEYVAVGVYVFFFFIITYTNNMYVDAAPTAVTCLLPLAGPQSLANSFVARPPHEFGLLLQVFVDDVCCCLSVPTIAT